MTIQRLSKLRDWQLRDPDQNLNGKVLHAQNGVAMGKVIDMVVDTEAGLVTSLVMQDDTHVATEDIDLRDGQIWLSESARQPDFDTRESTRFVAGERQSDVPDTDEEGPHEVRPTRDSASVREDIRKALEKHKNIDVDEDAHERRASRDLHRDLDKPHSDRQSDSNSP